MQRVFSPSILISSLALCCLSCGENASTTRAAGDAGTALDAPSTSVAQSGTRIRIADGTLEGERDRGSRRFLGIPFAEPPVDELRFRAPRPNAPWEGVRAATEFGGRCAQLDSLQGAATDNEDCLYLNVWVPDDAPAEPLPVMVWFHGGGNDWGSTSDHVPLNTDTLYYDGRALAANHGVIVVSSNYRLGALGFFPHPDLAAEDEPVGNQGLWDQRRALEWVRDNIAAFGGDAENVTLFGESAGSRNVCMHVAAGNSDPLFHRAISQSGGCTTRIQTATEAEPSIQAFADAMGCADAADPLTCLRDVPAGRLVEDAPILGGPSEPLPGGSRYQGGAPAWDLDIVVDGTFLTDQPRALFAAGSAADVTYILGSNTDEGTFLHVGATPVATEAEYLAALDRGFGDLAPSVAAQYPASDFESPNAALHRVSGDARLVCGTHDTARRAAEAGLTIRMYNFDEPMVVRTLASMGATHGAELTFVFDSMEGLSDEQARLRDLVQGYWSRFAASGDPNGGDALVWPEFASATDRRVNLAPDPSIVEDFRADLCAFWRETYDATF